MSVSDPMKDELVCQRSSPLTVAGLLGGIMVFTVPPFQRDYAWDDDAIDLFIGDVDRCRKTKAHRESSAALFWGDCNKSRNRARHGASALDAHRWAATLGDGVSLPHPASA